MANCIKASCVIFAPLCLSPFFPAGQVFLLLRGQRIDFNAHRFQFQAGDLFIDFFAARDRPSVSSLPLFLTRYSRHSAWLAKLISMTLAGWPFGGGQVDQPPSPSR